MSARRGWGTQMANPGAPEAQSVCACARGPITHACAHGPSTQWATTGTVRRSVEPLVRAGDQIRHLWNQLWAPAACRPCSSTLREPCTQWATTGPLMRSVETPVHAWDQAPMEPTLGPLQHSAAVRLRPGDPAPSGPPLGPVRRIVERNGGLGKGRNPRQNRGGQNQGRRRGHSAAYSTRDTVQARSHPRQP